MTSRDKQNREHVKKMLPLSMSSSKFCCAWRETYLFVAYWKLQKLVQPLSATVSIYGSLLYDLERQRKSLTCKDTVAS